MLKHNRKTYIILGIIIVLGLFNVIFYGLYLMDKEDRYGNLIYLKDELKDGDILIYSTYQSNDKYIDYGIVNKSFFGINIFDRKNRMKKKIYKWVDSNNILNVKAYRPLKLIDNKIEIEYLKDSTKYKYLGETN